MESSQNSPQALPNPTPAPGPASTPIDIKKSKISPLPFFTIAVLGFVLAAVVFALFSKPGSKKNPEKAAKEIKATPVRPVVSEPVVVVPVAEEHVADAEEAVLPALSLSGILFSSGESFALINGKVVPEGGVVEGAMVERISADTVELSFQGKKIILRSR